MKTIAELKESFRYTYLDLGPVEVNVPQKLSFYYEGDTPVAQHPNGVFIIGASCSCTLVDYNPETGELKVEYLPAKFSKAQLDNDPNMEKYRTSKFISVHFNVDPDNPKDLLAVPLSFAATVFKDLTKNLP